MERRKAKKPKGFQLIELDVGEDASQFMSQGNNTQKVGNVNDVTLGVYLISMLER